MMTSRTLLFGEGLFETILWRGKTNKLLKHYERLKKSAQYFHLSCPDFETFYKEIEKRTKGRINLYVKFCLISKGSLLYWSLPEKTEYLVLIKSYKSNKLPKKICLSKIRRHTQDPTVYHKTMNYIPNIMVKREALSRGFDDALLLNEKDEITECSASNIFIIKDNNFFTPSQTCGLLKGTTMEILIEKISIKEKPLFISDIYDASYVFITNTLMGVCPVIQFEDKIFRINPQLTDYLNSLIEGENSP